MTFIGWIIAFKMNRYFVQFVVFRHGYFFGLNILRNINEYRAWTTCASNKVRLFNDARQIMNILNKIVMLGYRHRNALDIRLLKRVLTDKGPTNLTSNGHHRYGIHVRSHNTCYKIRCTRTRGSKTYTYATRYASIAICRMCSTLFMTDEVMFNFREAIYFIINWNYRATWITEHIGYTKAMQCFKDNACPIDCFCAHRNPFNQLFRQYFAGI